MLSLITFKNKHQFEIIEGVIIRPLKVNKDDTGVLVETMRIDWQDVYDKENPFAMQYYSSTKSGVARDEALWHFHPGGQQDRFEVISGSIVVAIGDTREDSSTKGVLNLFYIKADEDPFMIVVPKKTLHAFMAVSDIPGILINFPTRLYDPKEEVRIPFNEAEMKLSDGRLFNWNLVREEFGLKIR